MTEPTGAVCNCKRDVRVASVNVRGRSTWLNEGAAFTVLVIGMARSWRSRVRVAYSCTSGIAFRFESCSSASVQ